MMRQYGRHRIPSSADLGDWEIVEPLLQDLLAREPGSAEELDRWLLERSEVQACLAEVRSRRYVDMTRDTANEEVERLYLQFIEEIVPRLKPYFDRLNRLFLASPYRAELDEERYKVLDRCIEAEVRIFREENIPLQTEASKLSQRYQKLSAAMTVTFDSKEHTLPQMAKVLEETDRERRQQAWELVAARRLRDRGEFDEIFDELLALRHQIAINAGFEDYRGYAFQSFLRFDYSPDDCLRFHDAVEAFVVPLARRSAEHRCEVLGLASLRPWDTVVDPQGRAPLRPFSSGKELADGVQRIFGRLDHELFRMFAEMRSANELDLESRVGKAPGGYLTTFEEVRRPFIFMNAAGVHRDVETLLHESGHAFHALACRQDPLLEYRHAPLEFAEVASMTMELFGDDYLDEFYDEHDAARAKRNHLEGIIDLLPWVARIDAFQHWIYANPSHDARDRSAAWLELEGRFGGVVNWSSYKEQRESLWQRQLHLFVHPFYYIEYGIAQLGALQIWRRSLEDHDAALKKYRAALALGGSRPLPELFEAAGASFELSASTIEPLVETLEQQLATLPP